MTPSDSPRCGFKHGDPLPEETEQSAIEGVAARPPRPISQAGQDYNDPGPDSLFERVDDETNRCGICGQLVYNNTESRDGHLNRTGCHL